MMNLFVYRLFARSSVSSLRTHSCSVLSHSLKMPRTAKIDKCFKSSTSIDQSKLSNSLRTDDFDFDEDDSISEVDVNAITNRDPKRLKEFQTLQLQVGVLKLQELEMPSSLSIENWKDLMMLTSLNQRRKFLQLLWKKEIRATMKEAQKLEKQDLYKKFKASQTSENKILTTSSPIEYSLTDVFLFHIIRDNMINQFYNYELLQAEWFGPHIILDCGYDLFMSAKNSGTCAREVMRAWSTNRENLHPFDVFLCNLNQKGLLWSKLVQLCPPLNLPDCPVHYTDEHYLKFFPKERLVYLTPHCDEVLEEFKHEDVYIIGAYVDFGSVEQLSLAKAKKEGLRKAKLPLDKFLKWKQGSKILTLPTVLAILNELKDGQSWSAALKHVPQNRVENDLYFDNSAEKPVKFNHLSAEYIRETYRKNLVYDLLLNKK